MQSIGNNTRSLCGKVGRGLLQRKDVSVIFISVAAAGIIYGMLFISGSTTLVLTDDAITERAKRLDNSIGQEESTTEKFDVLINSYMRSGSTITGHLLGHRDDVFYFYEPLRPYIRMSYFKGQDSICKYLSPSCKTPTSKVNEALEFLNAIYNCSFDQSDAMMRTISRVGLAMVMKSGSSWDVFVDCMQQNRGYNDCIPMLIPVCRAAEHRVTKVLRLSLDNTEDLLRDNPRLKVIHLLRDPRGTINSHIKTRWFPFSDKSQEAVRKDADALCSRMLHDIKAGKRLMRQFPNRAKIIHYEDFNDTIELAQYLYDFLGMGFSDKYRQHANTSDTRTATRKTDGYHKFSYRDTLSWETVQIIDTVCEDLYNESGYKPFATEQDLRNINVSAIQKRLTFSHID